MLGTAREIRCTGVIVDAAIEVHNHLGPGLFESMYTRCLAAELRMRGWDVEVEVPIDVYYKHIRLDVAYRLDLVVDGIVVVEVKTVPRLLEVHHSQLVTYLRATDRFVGLLLNFNCALMKQGIKRVYNPRPLRPPAVSVPRTFHGSSTEPPPTTAPPDAHRSGGATRVPDSAP